MCGRYALYEPQAVYDRFEVPKQEELDLRPNYNAAPGQFMPVITQDEQGRRLEIMKWGLVPHWAKDAKIGYKLINARAESAFEKPMWRSAISHHRCLVPAQGFYEWKAPAAPGAATSARAPHSHEDSLEPAPAHTARQPYFIHARNQALFAFAGVCSLWQHPQEGPLLSYSIVTTEPNTEMQSVHNRMPVILQPQDEAAWLDPTLHDRHDLERLLAPFPNGQLELYPVSPDVNSPKHNDARLLERLDKN